VPLTLFLFKIAVPPLLVALMSLAARRWGATVGGLIMGLPWMTGPVLLFLALDKGEAFAVRACLGIELAVLGISAFLLSYAAVSRFASWPISLMAAVASYGAAAMLTQDMAVPLWVAAASGAAALIATHLLVPKLPPATAVATLPWYDIPARMLATFSLVAVIMTSADRLGPQLSGIVASYPVIVTVIASFTHQQWGRDSVLRIFRGVSLSLLGFVAFFVVVGYGLPILGITATYAIAAAVSIATSALLITANRK
jgi:hypothetical protein